MIWWTVCLNYESVKGIYQEKTNGKRKYKKLMKSWKWWKHSDSSNLKNSNICIIFRSHHHSFCSHFEFSFFLNYKLVIMCRQRHRELCSTTLECHCCTVDLPHTKQCIEYVDVVFAPFFLDFIISIDYWKHNHSSLTPTH